MSRDQLRHIQMLIETGQIDEARDYLETNAENPAIQKLLDDFNAQHAPTSELDDLLELGGERDQKLLAQARQSLRSNRFADARALLIQIQHMPKARQWLEELNELEAELRLEAETAANAEREPVSLSQAVGDFVRSDNFRVLIGSTIIILGIIIIIGFFIFGAIETTVEARLSFLEEIESFTILSTPQTCTAFEIWRGDRSCQTAFAFDTTMASRSDKTGFIAVRSVDRFLIGMPIGALLLIILAWLYISETFDTLLLLMAIAGLAIALLLFPMIWQSVSDNVGTNADLARDQLGEGVESLTLLSYNATEHIVLTALILTLCISALGMMMLELSGMLGVPRNLLTAKGEVGPDLLKVFAERKRLGR